jgi:predicted HD phosphohydrolase
MAFEEALEFEKHPYASDAIRLRRWDDAAKDPLQATPPLSHFATYLRTVAARNSSA